MEQDISRLWDTYESDCFERSRDYSKKPYKDVTKDEFINIAESLTNESIRQNLYESLVKYYHDRITLEVDIYKLYNDIKTNHPDLPLPAYEDFAKKTKEMTPNAFFHSAYDTFNALNGCNPYWLKEKK